VLVKAYPGSADMEINSDYDSYYDMHGILHHASSRKTATIHLDLICQEFDIPNSNQKALYTIEGQQT